MPRYTVTVGVEVDIIAHNPLEAQDIALALVREDSDDIDVLSIVPRKEGVQN